MSTNSLQSQRITSDSVWQTDDLTCSVLGGSLCVMGVEDGYSLYGPVHHEDVRLSMAKRVAGGLQSTTVVVPKHDIESVNVLPVLRMLQTVYSDGESIHKYHGWLNLTVQGYTHDKRELFQIPEACEYFQKLSSAFPYLFYFLTTQAPMLNVIACCVSDARFVRKQGGKTFVSVDNEKLERFMSEQFAGVNRLFAQYDLDRRCSSLNREIRDRVTEYYQQRLQRDSGHLRRVYVLPGY